MADFPGSIYDPRTMENIPGQTYDPAKPTRIYAEDFNLDRDEIVAIEETLGEDPQGIYATVKEWLEALTSAVAGIVVSFLQLTDTPSSYTGAADKLVAVKHDETGLEFIAPPSGGGGLELVAHGTGTVNVGSTVLDLFAITGLDGDTDKSYELIIFLDNANHNNFAFALGFNSHNGSWGYKAAGSQLTITGATFYNDTNVSAANAPLIGNFDNSIYKVTFGAVIKLEIKAGRDTFGGNRRSFRGETFMHNDASEYPEVMMVGGVWSNSANNLNSIEVRAKCGSSPDDVSYRYMLYKRQLS